MHISYTARTVWQWLRLAPNMSHVHVLELVV